MAEIIDSPEFTGGTGRLEQLIRDGYSFDIGKCISRGFEIFQKYPGQFIGFTLLTLIGMIILSFIPFASILLSGPIAAAPIIIGWRVAKGKPVEFGNFFDGFQLFVPLLLASLIVGIFTIIGFIFLILPGIYLAIAYLFVNHLIVVYKMEFWPAMEYSRKLVTKNWWQFFGLAIVLGLINVLGALVLGIGLLVTIPASGLAVYAAFESIVGLPEEN
jgi:hypothetical protein